MQFSRKTILLGFLLLFLTASSAQNFQGKAYYFSKTSVDMDSWGGRQMSEDQKKQIADRMRSMFEKTYILNFDREASTYKEEEVLEKDKIIFNEHLINWEEDIYLVEGVFDMFFVEAWT